MEAVNDNELVYRWLDEMRLKDFNEKSIKNYQSCIRVYQRWIEKNGLSLLSARDKKDKWVFEKFLSYLRSDYRKPDGGPMSYSRMKLVFTALNSFYDFLEYNDGIEKNMVLAVRKRYLKQFKNGYVPARRKIIEIQEMGRFLNSIPDVRDRAMIVIDVKTGLRRGELISLNTCDVDMDEMMITLNRKMFHKRTNPYVFFDDETKRVLNTWLKRRPFYADDGEDALFVGVYGGRICHNAVHDAMEKWATRFGIHDPDSGRLEDHFTFHNLRHCFTTYMRKNGMSREFIMELRGDQRRETIDIYNHIDLKELKREYLAAVPQFHLI